MDKKNIFNISVKYKIWSHTILLSLLIYIFFALLNYYIDKNFGIIIFSKALAGTSAILFAISFSMSGLCYYFDFLDQKICYRKYLGLAGFWFALLYSISLLFLEADKYFYGFWDNLFTADLLLGISSMTIFTFLAVISNDNAMIKLGPKRWRRLMRWGYFAWTLLVIRAWILEEAMWQNWLNTYQGFPPTRLLLSLLVIIVIILRLSIEINKFFKRKQRHLKGNE